MKNKYRVITDKFNGYEAQVKYWYWPFWKQLPGTDDLPTNSSTTIEEAIDIINYHRREIIKPPKFVSKVIWQDPPDNKPKLKDYDTNTTTENRESL